MKSGAVEDMSKVTGSKGLSVEIEVDGCINKVTIPKVVQAGANILVLGRWGLFGVKRDKSSVIREIRELAESAKSGVSKA